jgi:hypothetical protein
MELMLALIVFALLIVAWLALPGTAVVAAVEDAPMWSSDVAVAPASVQ